MHIILGAEVEDATSAASATPYFCLAVLLGALILVNLIVAVLYVQCRLLRNTRLTLEGREVIETCLQNWFALL